MSKTVLTDMDFGGVAKVTGLAAPSGSSDAATKSYVDGAIQPNAWKDNVRVKAQVNINLSAPGASIDGITMANGDRFLAPAQTTTSQNGIYIFNGAATPATRASDADTADKLEQATVTVDEGTEPGTTWRQTQVNFVLDTDPVAFTSFGNAAPSASESTPGLIEIATQAETDTGTDDARAITPLKLTTWSGRKRKATATIGDGSATSFNIDHNFGMRDVVVEVYKNSGNYDTVIADVTRPSTNRVTLTFAAAPASNAYNVVIIG